MDFEARLMGGYHGLNVCVPPPNSYVKILTPLYWEVIRS